MPVKIMITGESESEMADSLKAISMIHGILPVDIMVKGESRDEIIDVLKALTLLKETGAEARVFMLKGSGEAEPIPREVVEELLGVKLE